MSVLFSWLQFTPLAAGVLIEKPDWVIEQTNGAWA
jgi:hypothetical protein